MKDRQRVTSRVEAMISDVSDAKGDVERDDLQIFRVAAEEGEEPKMRLGTLS